MVEIDYPPPVISDSGSIQASPGSTSLIPKLNAAGVRYEIEQVRQRTAELMCRGNPHMRDALKLAEALKLLCEAESALDDCTACVWEPAVPV